MNRSEVLRIERELEEARSRLTAIRQAKYKQKGENSPSDGEQEGFDSYNRYQAPLEPCLNLCSQGFQVISCKKT